MKFIYREQRLIKLFVFILTLVLMTGCGTNNSTEISKTGYQKDIQKKPETVQEKQGESKTYGKNKYSYDFYQSLLFKIQDDISNLLGEEPEKVEDDVMDYKKAGIRVWFERGNAYKLHTRNKKVDFNNVFIGEDIKKFKDAFGKVTQDKDGKVHFNYDSTYVIVEYEEDSGITTGVYLTNEDYADEKE